MPLTLAVCVLLPVVGSEPLHATPLAPPPLAVQALTEVPDQLSVKVDPFVTEVGLAVSVTDGVTTVSFACVEAVPWFGSMLLQVIPNVNTPGSLTLLTAEPFGGSPKLLLPAAPQMLPGAPPVSAHASALHSFPERLVVLKVVQYQSV